MSDIDSTARFRISILETKLSALYAHLGLEEPEQELPSGVGDALRAGNMIEAIKLYREATGADLATAKEEIEKMRG